MSVLELKSDKDEMQGIISDYVYADNDKINLLNSTEIQG